MAKKAESYETLLIKLEEIISTMEAGDFPLDEAMKNYEEGIKLSNKLYKLLNEAEGKIKVLTEAGEKSFSE